MYEVLKLLGKVCQYDSTRFPWCNRCFIARDNSNAKISDGDLEYTILSDQIIRREGYIRFYQD